MNARFLRLIAPLALVAGLGLSACQKGKPSRDECRAAVTNVKKLAGTDQSQVGADPRAAIRSCTSNSSKATVQCVAKAKTMAELKGCEGQVGAEYYKQEEEADKVREQKVKDQADKDQEDKDEAEKDKVESKDSEEADK